jgi:hypothetical protein
VISRRSEEGQRGYREGFQAAARIATDWEREGKSFPSFVFWVCSTARLLDDVAPEPEDVGRYRAQVDRAGANLERAHELRNRVRQRTLDQLDNESRSGNRHDD